MKAVSEEAIQIKGASKVYVSDGKDGKKIQAIKNISFSIGKEEFVSIVGPSGCGKSTLINLISGLIPITSGSIKVGDKEVVGPRRDIGIVFQYPVLLEWRNILDNVLLPIEVLKMKKASYIDRAMKLLELVGLVEFKEAYPNELSGGMQQRACICRALIHDPSLLLMDEPFGSLDAMTREEMNLWLLDLWAEQKKTILFVTHSISEAVFLSDRVIVLSCRPSMVDSIFKINFPRPRPIDIMYTDQFRNTQAQIRRKIGFGSFSRQRQTEENCAGGAL